MLSKMIQYICRFKLQLVLPHFAYCHWYVMAKKLRKLKKRKRLDKI